MTILLRPGLYCGRWILPRASDVFEIRSELPSDRAIEEPDSNEGRERITINLLELCGIVMTAYVTQVILQDRPKMPGDTVLLRGDNVSAVSWINRCGGSRNRRAALTI